MRLRFLAVLPLIATSLACPPTGTSTESTTTGSTTSTTATSAASTTGVVTGSNSSGGSQSTSSSASSSAAGSTAASSSAASGGASSSSSAAGLTSSSAAANTASSSGSPVTVIINEVFYDDTGTDENAFVELKGVAGTSLTGWRLVGVNGSNGTAYNGIDLTGTIPADGFYVVTTTTADQAIQDLADQTANGADYQNGADSIQLRQGSTVIDAVGYGFFDVGDTFGGEGNACADSPSGFSISRDSNAVDTNDNSVDFSVQLPSPRANGNRPPVVALQCPAGGSTGATLSFDASGSADLDGTIADYAFDFGDTNIANGTNAMTDHVYAATGSFTVTVTVTDGAGAIASTTCTVIIDDGSGTTSSSGGGSSSSGGNPPAVIISEVLYDSVDADNDTFVELYGPPGADLTGFDISGVNGSTGQRYNTIALNGQIPTNGFFLVVNTAANAALLALADQLAAGVDYQNGPDNIQLRYNGTVVDALGYGTFEVGDQFLGENNPAVDTGEGESLGRDAAQYDTDDNFVDFTVYAVPTPGELNLPPNDPPVAALSCPASADVGEIVTLDATASSDADGTIVTFTFDADDGNGPFVDDDGIVALSFGTAGQYDATVTVTDNRGDSDTVGCVIDVLPLDVTAPEIITDNFNLATDLAGETTSFAASVTFSEEVTGVDAGITVDNGASITNVVTADNITFTFDVEGLAPDNSYLVSFTDGISDLASNPLVLTTRTITLRTDIPYVVSHDAPANPLPAMTRETVIRVVFSEQVVVRLVDTQLDAQPNGIVEFAEGTNGIEYAFRIKNLRNATTFTLDLTSEIRDLDGNSLTPETITFSVAGNVVYVVSGGTGAQDGSTPNDAYADINTALAALAPDTDILVATGTYDESISPTVDVGIYGGFDAQFLAQDFLQPSVLTTSTELTVVLSTGTQVLTGFRIENTSTGITPTTVVCSTATPHLYFNEIAASPNGDAMSYAIQGLGGCDADIRNNHLTFGSGTVAAIGANLEGNATHFENNLIDGPATGSQAFGIFLSTADDTRIWRNTVVVTGGTSAAAGIRSVNCGPTANELLYNDVTVASAANESYAVSLIDCGVGLHGNTLTNDSSGTTAHVLACVDVDTSGDSTRVDGNTLVTGAGSQHNGVRLDGCGSSFINNVVDVSDGDSGYALTVLNGGAVTVTNNTLRSGSIGIDLRSPVNTVANNIIVAPNTCIMENAAVSDPQSLLHNVLVDCNTLYEDRDGNGSITSETDLNNPGFTTQTGAGTSAQNLAVVSESELMLDVDFRPTPASPTYIREGGLNARTAVCGATLDQSCGDVFFDRDEELRSVPYSVGAYEAN